MSSPASSSMHKAATLRGVGYGMGAGALWGLVFLAPKLVSGFNGIEMAAGRYLAYGLIAGLMLLPRWRALRAKITGRDWQALIWLSLFGNILYYILLSTAIQTGGIAMTSLVIGFLPVAVTIIGSRDHGAVPLRKLTLSLLFCAAGAICIGGQALANVHARAPGSQILGLICAMGALVSWTGFAVGNSRCLARLEGVSSDDWNLLTGLVTGVQALILVPVAFLTDRGTHTIVHWSIFIGVSTGVAIFASIAGNALWNRMSRLLPLTLIGQMILFETLFALIYGFAWERRLPTLLEAAAFICVVISVVACIHAHGKPQTAA